MFGPNIFGPNVFGPSVFGPDVFGPNWATKLFSSYAREECCAKRAAKRIHWFN